MVAVTFAKVAAADVGARARSGVVTVQAEQAEVLALAAVTTTAQHDTTGVVVAIVQNRNRPTGREHRTTGTVAPKLDLI